jgi:hypothetical protein
MKRLLALLLLIPFLFPLSASAQTHWFKQDGPMLDVGEPGTWDSSWALINRVLIHENQEIYYYTGSNGQGIRIGRAQWPFGAMHREIVIEPNLAWERTWTNFPYIVKDQDGFKMWYTGGYHTGYATSSDGVTWTKHPTPIMALGPRLWDQRQANYVSVLYIDGEYKMWYTGQNNSLITQIGYATSEDGIEWTKHPANPVLSFGEAGSWDDRQIGYPRVIHNGQFYEMWYSGTRGDVSDAQIGYATSDDGVNWTKSPLNPVLVPGPAAWEANAVGPGEVHFNEEEGKYLIWYYGFDGHSERSGNAISYRGSDISISDDVLLVGDTLEIKLFIPNLSPHGPHGSEARIMRDNELIETISMTGVEGEWHAIFVPDHDGPHTISLMLYWRFVGYTMHNAASFTVGTVSVPGEPPGALKLSVASVHPNPARGVVSIAYDLPQAGPVTVEVFDVLGRRVALLEELEKPAGMHEVRWDASAVAAGVYVVSVRAKGEEATARVTITP